MQFKKLFFCGLIMVQQPSINSMICCEAEGLFGAEDDLINEEPGGSELHVHDGAEACLAAENVLAFMRKWNFWGRVISSFSDQQIMDLIGHETVATSFVALSGFFKHCESNDQGKAFLVILSDFVNSIERHCDGNVAEERGASEPFAGEALCVANQLATGTLCKLVQQFLSVTFPEKQWPYINDGFFIGQLARMIIPSLSGEAYRRSYCSFLANLDVPVGLLEFIFLIKLRMACAGQAQRVMPGGMEHGHSLASLSEHPLAAALKASTRCNYDHVVCAVGPVDDDNDHK